MHWSELEFTEVRPSIFGATTDSEQLTTTIYRYEPGCEWETHAHPEDQMTYVTEGGTIDFDVTLPPLSVPGGTVIITLRSSLTSPAP